MATNATMASNPNDSSKQNIEQKSHGEKSGDGIGSLLRKLNLLKMLVKREQDVALEDKGPSMEEVDLFLETVKNNFTKGDRDHPTDSEECLPLSIRVPHTLEKPRLPWKYLVKNQGTDPDQSMKWKRCIYHYICNVGKAQISNGYEEDLLEVEEAKHEFSRDQDRILWMIFQEHGHDEQVLNLISRCIRVDLVEIQDRYPTLKYKHEQNLKNSWISRSKRGISLDMRLSAALDTYNLLFCRRCLIFDCQLHGCAQPIIYPIEKKPYRSQCENDRSPCSDQCYLQFRANRTVIEHNEGNSLLPGALNTDSLKIRRKNHGSVGKRKGLLQLNTVGDHQGSSAKKQKKSVLLDINTMPNDSMLSLDRIPTIEKEHIYSGILNENRGRITARNGKKESPIHTMDRIVGTGIRDRKKWNRRTGMKHGPKSHEQSLSAWKPLEKDLYLKGVEIFGRNSCVIARNLLTGLKTCIEISNYMGLSGPSVLQKFTTSKSVLEENGSGERDNMEQEAPRRARKSQKLKFSRNLSSRKRIADDNNKLCKHYTPCRCQPVCGKECPCLQNGICCEKYCGCLKSCKNLFRGCHCVRSQCRSKQCPCFAAARECDSDVCRNCWISCGDGTLGEPEPPRPNEGRCDNMKVLLRQHQRILLGKSDVAGLGAFLKNSANKNDYLGEYTGEVISHEEADFRGAFYDHLNSSFLFDLNDECVIDAYGMGNKLKFANHSSKPNCYAKVLFVAGDHRVGIFAKKRIEAGDELFYDYCYVPNVAPDWAKKPDDSKKKDTPPSGKGKGKK